MMRLNLQRLITSTLISSALMTVSGAWASTASVSPWVPIHVVLATGQVKELHLPRISLTADQQQAFSQQRVFFAQPQLKRRLQNGLPAEFEVGMGNVPVFDQGAWGTCATFAATAGLDALLNLTDEAQVSQLCNLQLGRSLQVPDSDGGWEGSYGYAVLGQLDTYGYLPMSYQYSHGCGGLTEYPAYSYDNGSPMPVSEFQSQSLSHFTQQDWSTLLPFNHRFRPLAPEKGEIVLQNVKQHLLAGHRVLFGTLLDASKGDAGCYGSYHKIKDDAWVLTDTILNNLSRGRGVAGHEMLIIGYADNACATFTDEKHLPRQQCGLLRLRNSWSTYAGERGDYYMSYDYFKSMVLEAYALGKGVKATAPTPSA